MVEKLSREEAIEYLTMQRDLMADTMDDAAKVLNILEQTGDRIGYTPAFRCLVKGIPPRDSIKWGK